jgi:hypothetical protein
MWTYPKAPHRRRSTSSSLFFALAISLSLFGASCVTATPMYSAPAPARPPPTSVGMFYDPLAPYGAWVWVDAHGWVWSPRDVPFGWQPYTCGEWYYTPDYGWTWSSCFSWGWAPFHYGRWAMHPRYGWIWVPGDTWAPAWVVWRDGPGVVGWAPLPPDAVWIDGRLVWRRPVTVVVVGGAWVFVESRYVVGHRINRVVLSRQRASAEMSRTRVVYRYDRGDAEHRVVNRGVDPQRIERETGRAVPRTRAVPVDRPRAEPRERVDTRDRAQPRDRLEIYSPDPRTRATPRSRDRDDDKKKKKKVEKRDPRDRAPAHRTPSRSKSKRKKSSRDR